MTQQTSLQGTFDPAVPTRIVFGNGKVDSSVSYTHLTLPTTPYV